MSYIASIYIKLSSTIMTRRHASRDEQWEKLKIFSLVNQVALVLLQKITDYS